MTSERVERSDDLPEMAASLLDFWYHFNAQANRPTRDDFTPFSLKKWLGYLDVYGIEDDGEVIRIRLNGTRVTELTGEDWTGRTARDVDRKFDSKLHDDVMEVVRSRQPSIHETQIFQKDYASAHRLMLPIFSREGDGKVTQVLLALFWGD